MKGIRRVEMGARVFRSLTFFRYLRMVRVILLKYRKGFVTVAGHTFAVNVFI